MKEGVLSLVKVSESTLEMVIIKVTSSEMTHLRAETEFWEGEASCNIFQ